MVVPLERYDGLRKWMEENEIQFSQDVVVRVSPLGGVGVFAQTDIDEGTVLLEVPKEHILSPVT